MPSGNKKQNSEKEYRNPIPTVDVILRKSRNNRQEILIEKRGRPPFEGKYSLPGGHVEYGETVEHAALRELDEETGVRARLVEILGVYSDPKRDPRGQRITTVFISDYIGGRVKANDDAKSAEWIDVKKLLKKGNEDNKIAFDHYQILSDYQKWLQSTKTRNTFWSTKRRHHENARFSENFSRPPQLRSL
jgi:8-oxo-dGTP diphosphatase